MARIIMSRRDDHGDYEEEITCKVKGKEEFAREMCERFMAANSGREGITIHGATMKIGNLPQERPELKEEVVAIYDNAGIPSFMYRITKKKNSDLFPGGSEKVHPAFIIGGKEYDEIYISVYPNCNIDGKPYSLPRAKPWTNITNDEAAKTCFSKGEGWHLMTRAEWGLLANLSLKNGTLPHGNTNYGKYNGNETEMGKLSGDYGITLTGSGPSTWTHNHQLDGVHDLCGDIWEMVRGFRIKNGFLESAKNNDAAMDIDLSAEGDDWFAVVDDEGKPIRISVNNGVDIAITSEKETEDTEHGYDGCEWGNVTMDCNSEALKELALFPGEPEAYLYADSRNGEYLPMCGGSWGSIYAAGVFCVSLHNTRTESNSGLGFRSAFYRKQVTEN